MDLSEVQAPVSAQVLCEDPRYPKLILDGDGWTRGYWIDTDTGELDRFCVCHAHSSSECTCGVWDEEEYCDG